MASITEFIKNFQRDHDKYRIIEKQVENFSKEILSSKNIAFIWQSRVKEPSSLEAKLRNRSSKYESDIQNIGDIKDIVAGRILLTRWRDIELIKATLNEKFNVREQTQHPKEEQNAGSRKSRFQGYNAVHFYVAWPVPQDGQVSHLVIEIQVLSLVMSSWAELEHNFKYKQLNGEVSENVSFVLEAIKGHANSQEVLLELFEKLLDPNPDSARLQQYSQPFLARLISENKQSVQRDLQREQYQANLQRECFQVLRTSDYERHKARNPDPVEGTCQWILQHSHFIHWRESQHSHLIWVSADPGCGKSVLSKSLIDKDLQTTDSRTTCYFFFKDDNADQQSITFALNALLHQLFSQKEELIKYAIEQFEKEGTNLARLFDAQWNLLTKATADPEAGEVICILDALDECQDGDRETLIGALKQFYHGIDKPKSSLKFLVTSRPYYHIERLFHHTVRLAGEDESELISREIDLVIKARVRKITVDMKLKPTVKSSLESALLNIEHRTYLWVHLIFDVIENSLTRTEKGLCEIVRTLPDTVENAYTAILERSLDKILARKLLHIVIAAIRPLTLEEMNVALAINDGDKSYGDMDLEQEEWFRTKVKDLCGLFVSVVDSKIYLIHQTAKEFLMLNKDCIETPNHAVLGNWKQSLEPRVSHRILAKACIWFLLFDVFESHPPVANVNDWVSLKRSRDIERYINAHSFLQYAAANWVTHFQEAEVEDETLHESVAFKICDTRSGRFRSWFLAYPGWINEAENTSTNLIIASHFGFTRTVRMILEYGRADIDARNFDGDTALHSAVKNKKNDVVRLLLEKGANINAKNNRGTTALHYATQLYDKSDKGRIDAVQLLLEANADVKAVDCEGDTALHMAVSMCAYGVVESLLENDVNIDALNNKGSSALYLTQEYGAHEIGHLLVAHGADLDTADEGADFLLSPDSESEDGIVDPASSPMEVDL